ncbi:response regulator [Nitratireductor basaltis]|uniref:Alkaline phosphatase synthesis transcriptional regulatory protein PhoP n=1 Tax=Nitratireductor basaltis TaxID=472175 RepID=A0A084U654_9HYPH|nr:response regulator [Nitratireductor basaltis]KFB08440.1 Alkaline phosphatase synthesis transcriptional regulatory protein PhoP [Nitratireductor basaltis]
MYSTPKRLLSVDDDASSAELVVRVAERCGYEAFATSDSRGVINLVRALKPEVMAIDINMPNIDAAGLFVLLAQDKYAGKIIIVSGEDEIVLRKTQAKAVEHGLRVPEIQQKPLDFARLRKILMQPNDVGAAA